MQTHGERMLLRLRDFQQAKGQGRSPLRKAGDSAHRIDEQRDGVRLSLDFEEVDKLGLRMRRFQAAMANPAETFDLARLRRQAEEIARRVSYLTENIALIEIDQSHGKAQLRSQAPLQEKSGKSYFEILLNGNHSLSLCRYEISGSASPRQLVAFGTTQEIFERLVNDFVAVLSLG